MSLKRVVITALIGSVLAIALRAPTIAAAPKLFAFDPSVTPMVTCSPSLACSLTLCGHESVIEAVAGDTVHWQIVRGGGSVPIYYVKPTELGIPVTNLIVRTSARMYQVYLFSSPVTAQTEYRFDCGPKLASVDRVSHWKFGPDTETPVSSASRVQSTPMPVKPSVLPASPPPIATASPMPSAAPILTAAATAQPLTTTPVPLDFKYRVDGSAPFAPTVVYSDGVHTYIQIPPTVDLAPSVYAIGANGTELYTPVHPNPDDIHLLRIDMVAPKFVLKGIVGTKEMQVTIVREK